MMVTQKALPYTCPFTILFCHFSHQEVKSIPSYWIWIWLVNDVDQDEAKMTQCDFCAYALRDITGSIFVLSKCWVSRWESQNSLACWGEVRCTEVLGIKSMGRTGSKQQGLFSHPSRITRHVGNTSFLPAAPNLVAPGMWSRDKQLPPSPSHLAEWWASAGCFKFWVLRALSCCNRVWRGSLQAGRHVKRLHIQSKCQVMSWQVQKVEVGGW